MKLYIKAITLAIIVQFFVFDISAQEITKNVEEMTREEILNIPYDELIDMPLEQLLKLADIVGVSLEELYEMILNKDIVSASKSEETSFESPLSSTVVTGEEIEKSGVTSIPEALRLVPGIVVREKTPGNYDVHIRGNDNVPPKNILLYSENSMALVMIDGRPVYNYAFGGTFWETLPIGINDIERIEVIRGPSSALYGPNAVTGVINIVTKDTKTQKPTFSASAQGGTNQSIITNAAAGFGLGDKLSVRFSGNYKSLGRFHETLYYIDDGKYYPRTYLDTLRETDPMLGGMLVEDNLPNKVPHPDRSADQYGVNGFLSYDLTEDIGFDVTLGTQKSDNMANVLGNHDIPFLTRYSNTSYLDFKANAHGLNFQINYLEGDQDVERTNKGFHMDIETLNSSLEYELKLGSLKLRPGISYQKAIYSDANYVDVEIKEGYLNGTNELNTLAYFLRADYTLKEKLRLIAAVRGDKYNSPDDTYFTYQFISTYSINENNLLRGVYSRANRGPFMADNYSDYIWHYIPGFFDMYWTGNQELNLAVMDQIEFGYRVKPAANIQADIEFFQTKTKDFTYFAPVDMSLTLMTTAEGTPIFDGTGSPVYYMQSNVSYRNFDLISIQQGATANISMVVNKDLNFKLFGTLQSTKLKNFYPKTTFETLGELPSTTPDSIVYAIPGVLPGYMHFTTNFDETEDLTHKATPTFYGGLMMNYNITSKLFTSVTGYFYSKQTFDHIESTVEIDPKFLLNLSLSYKVWDENEIFVNARNLLGNDKVQFAYADMIGMSIYGGIRLNF